jgi:osmotically inducible protein OsmC
MATQTQGAERNDASPLQEPQRAAAGIVKSAQVVWTGTFKAGSGVVSTESGVLREAPYGFHSRFEGGKGTNPEELVAAAHGSCFSMALALVLSEAGLAPTRIATEAQITLTKGEGGYSVTASHLDVSVAVPGVEDAAFQALASKARDTCPMSRLLRAPITMSARLA